MPPINPERLFEVHGPYVIPGQRHARGFRLDTDAWSTQLERHSQEWPPSLARSDERSGVYLLGRRHGDRIHYFYVGMSEVNLVRELQGPHNRLAICEEMQGNAGTPVVTLVVYKRRPNEQRCGRKVLLDLEEYFIQQALTGGHVLKNKNKVGDPAWGVIGLTVRRRGAPTRSSANLKRQLRFGTAPMLRN